VFKVLRFCLPICEKLHVPYTPRIAEVGLHIFHLEDPNDREGKTLRVVDVNQAAEDFTGVSREEVLGKTLDENFPGLREKGIPQTYAEVVISGEPRVLEDIYYDDKRVIEGWFVVKAFPLPNNHVGVAFENIAEKKKTEQALSDSEKKYRSLYSAMSEGVCLHEIVYDESDRAVDYRIIDVNPAYESIISLDRDDAIGKRASELYGTGKPPFLDIFSKVAETGTSTSFEIYWPPMEKHFQISVFSPGKGMFATVFTDMTQRKQAEQVLRESEERYKRLVETIPHGIQEIDINGNIVFANKAFHDIYGYENEELIGTSIFDLSASDSEREELKEYFAKLIKEQPEPAPYISNNTTKQGRTIVTQTDWNYKKDDANNVTGFTAIITDITQRKKAEEELERERDRAQRYLDVAGVMLVALDTEGRVTLMNPKGREILGHSCSSTPGHCCDDILGRNWFDTFLPERIRENVRGVFAQLIAGNIEPVDYFENPVLTRSGEERIIAWHNAVLTDQDGKTVGTLGSGEDITERKRAEEARLESEHRYHSLFENMLNGFAYCRIVVDDDSQPVDWVYLEVNDAFETVTGLTPEGVLGKRVTEAIPGIREAHPELFQIYGRVAQTGQEETFEIYLQPLDIWLSISVYSPVKGHFVALFENITERKKAEEALTHSEARFRSLFECMGSGVAVYEFGNNGKECIFKDLNGAAERIENVKKGDVVGRNVLDVFPGAETGFVDVFKRVWETGRPEFNTNYTYSEEGKMDTARESYTYRLPSGEIVAVYEDITERKSAEEALKAVYEEEHQLRQQLEVEISKRVQFIRALAHELKTPLTSALAASDLLVTQLSEEPQLSLARNIYRSATNLDSRVEELLDLARGELGMLDLKLEPVDILQLLRQTADDMKPLASRQGLTLSLDLPPTLPSVDAEAGRVQQILVNLLSNAIKFSPENGRVALGASVRQDSVVVEVRDTGSGISKAEQQRLFEPYHRVEGDRDRLSGLGLGLALCKNLVELHGGRIWVESRPGEGSTFSFSLPIEVNNQMASRSQEKADALCKVLIIEDDNEIVDVVSLAFQITWPEAQLLSASKGEKGVDMVEREDPDLVILDLGLPDIAGFEVLRRIRAFSPVPIVVLTVRTGEDDIVKALEWGADDYVAKPFRQKEFLARLQALARRRTPHGEVGPVVCGPLRLDPSTAQLTYGRREIGLTTVEGRVLHCLMRHAGDVVTHSRLGDAVWGEDYPGAIESIRVHIRRLREKLEEDPGNPKLIRTKAGVGYSLVKPT